MEILGKYKVRGPDGEKTIRAPDSANGEYHLQVYEDGHFSYFPADGQSDSPSKKVQWIVTSPELDDAVTFTNEKSATEYKLLMEKNQGKVFRMKKVFPSAGIKTLGEPC
jgi:hypothetical protein